MIYCLEEKYIDIDSFIMDMFNKKKTNEKSNYPWYNCLFSATDFLSKGHLDKDEMVILYQYIEGELHPRLIPEIQRILRVEGGAHNLKVKDIQFREVCSILSIFSKEKILSKKKFQNSFF